MVKSGRDDLINFSCGEKIEIESRMVLMAEMPQARYRTDVHLERAAPFILMLFVSPDTSTLAELC